MNPYIGLIVDYYPSPSERHAAIIVQIHNSDPDSRPNVNLRVFSPDSEGDVYFKDQVPPVDASDCLDLNDLEIEGKWAFAHEYAVKQNVDHDVTTENGTNSNEMVGKLTPTFDY